MSKGKRRTRRKPPSRSLAPQRRAEEAHSPELETQVRLKPFLGISPGVYLTVLLGIIVLFVLFMLLFFKGIRDQGTYLQVSSFPPRAAVQVDGMYAGSTPCEILLKKGFRSVRVSRPFFRPEVMEDHFGGRVFATLFVKPRRTWDVRLQLEDSAGLARHALEDFAANPQIPEVLWQTALAAYQADPQSWTQLDGFLDNSRYFVTNPLQLNEFLRARAVLDSGARILTPTSLLQSVRNIAQDQVNYQHLPFWLSVVLPEEQARQVVQSDWFTGFLARYQGRYNAAMASAQAAAPGRAASGTVSVLGQGFRAVPGGTLLQGASEERNLTVQLPHPVAVAPLYVSVTEVPARLYAQFLQDSPTWRRGNLEQLLKDERVTEEYLQAWENGRPPAGDAEKPIVNVSFYAAEAFCAWLTGQLPAALADYEARLPSESEWEWAARGGLVAQSYPLGAAPGGAVFFGPGVRGPAEVGASSANGYGLQDMAGNVWEWCSDWYSPVKYLFTSWEAERNAAVSAEEPPTGFEKVVRGGSWSNERELVRVHTRGSQPPSWCTPYLGFRVVLARIDR